MNADQESNVTEIFIGATGRVFAFGLSRQVLELLSKLQPADHRLEQLRQAASASPGAGPVEQARASRRRADG